MVDLVGGWLPILGTRGWHRITSSSMVLDDEGTVEPTLVTACGLEISEVGPVGVLPHPSLPDHDGRCVRCAQ